MRLNRYERMRIDRHQQYANLLTSFFDETSVEKERELDVVEEDAVSIVSFGSLESLPILDDDDESNTFAANLFGRTSLTINNSVLDCSIGSDEVGRGEYPLINFIYDVNKNVHPLVGSLHGSVESLFDGEVDHDDFVRKVNLMYKKEPPIFDTGKILSNASRVSLTLL